MAATLVVQERNVATTTWVRNRKRILDWFF
jgi:hypothetical protein